MPLNDCGKCWLEWDPDNGQFDLVESEDCPVHGWGDLNEEDGELREDQI